MDVDAGTGGTGATATAWLLADAGRAAMCRALRDGRYWTDGELASVAGLRQEQAAGLLAPLVDCGMIDRLKPGRSSYYALAGRDAGPAARAAPPPGASAELCAGRTCYDHLAGQLGVAITRLLIGSGVITPGFGHGSMTPLAPLRLVLPARPARPVVRPCVDWTERRRHAAGALPAALASRMIELGWLRRTGRSRAIALTQPGLDGLADLLPGAAQALADCPALA